MQSLLETARTTALAEGDLIRVALEHQMIENDRTLIASMIESFRKQSRVERLVLLDRDGSGALPRRQRRAGRRSAASTRPPARPATAIRPSSAAPAASSKPAAARCCAP